MLLKKGGYKEFVQIPFDNLNAREKSTHKKNYVV